MSRIFKNILIYLFLWFICTTYVLSDYDDKWFEKRVKRWPELNDEVKKMIRKNKCKMYNNEDVSLDYTFRFCLRKRL